MSVDAAAGDAVSLRAAGPGDFPSVLALNEASVRFLNPLTPQRLTALDAQSALHLVAEEGAQVVAFLLALREHARYDSINYQWFEARYPCFLYIDRVVVATAARGRGIGALLYQRAFACAAATGVPVLACEFDVEPPNPASARFHAKFGFREVGRQAVADGTKQVSLQVAPVPRAAP